MTLFLQAGSRNYASPTPLPVNDLEKKMTATSGRKCLEQYAKFNRPTLWGKMFSASLIGTGDWFSTKCRLTWKLRGTKYNRLYFQLVPSTHRTDVIGFGLLPTPAATEGFNSGAGEAFVTETGTVRMKNQDGSSSRLGLEGVLKFQMLPTPTAMDSSGATANMKSTQVKEGSMHSVTLSRWANMLPTPTSTSDMKGGCTRINEKRQNDTLAHAMHAATNGKPGTTSQLNPPFVLEMMGFPPDWTALPFLSGETNQ